jgi:hypothetical protein
MSLAGCSVGGGRLLWSRMLARPFLQLVLLIALLLAPVCMLGGGAAMATPAVGMSSQTHAMTADAGHCAELGERRHDKQDRSADLDCRTTCSGVLTQGPVLRVSLVIASMPQNMALAAAEPGLNPAAEPPPPRLS